MLTPTPSLPPPTHPPFSHKDPLTGGSSIIGPEAKLGAAVAALFLSFFSLAQASRAVYCM
jgi:hypothetical protein